MLRMINIDTSELTFNANSSEVKSLDLEPKNNKKWNLDWFLNISNLYVGINTYNDNLVFYYASATIKGPNKINVNFIIRNISSSNISTSIRIYVIIKYDKLDVSKIQYGYIKDGKKYSIEDLNGGQRKLSFINNGATMYGDFYSYTYEPYKGWLAGIEKLNSDSKYYAYTLKQNVLQGIDPGTVPFLNGSKITADGPGNIYIESTSTGLVVNGNVSGWATQTIDVGYPIKNVLLVIQGSGGGGGSWGRHGTNPPWGYGGGSGALFWGIVQIPSGGYLQVNLGAAGVGGSEWNASDRNYGQTRGSDSVLYAYDGSYHALVTVEGGSCQINNSSAETRAKVTVNSNYKNLIKSDTDSYHKLSGRLGWYSWYDDNNAIHNSETTEDCDGFRMYNFGTRNWALISANVPELTKIIPSHLGGANGTESSNSSRYGGSGGAASYFADGGRGGDAFDGDAHLQTRTTAQAGYRGSGGGAGGGISTNQFSSIPYEYKNGAKGGEAYLEIYF